MNKKISIFLICLLLANNLCVIVHGDETSIKDQINSNNSKIEEIEAARDETIANIEIETENLEEINSLITAKQEDLNKIQGRIDELQSSIDQIQSDIIEKENSIIQHEEEISVKNKEIDELRKKEVETKEMLDNRLVMYYKTDITNSALYVLLSSESIFQFLNSLNGIYKVITTDKTLIEKFKSTQAELVSIKDELEVIVQSLEDEKLLIKKEEENLLSKQEEIIEEKLKEQEEMSYLASLEAAKEEVILALNLEKDSLNEQIEDLISFNEELQAELDSIMNNVNSGNDTSTDTGDEYFLRPTPGPITCDYGFRYDPINGTPGFHTGTDFGDPYGTSIAASKSGTVQHAGWINGYGNCVIIGHGNGVQTLYAHAESLNVSVGQYVNRGDTVAFVGSTGWSTGPHLHFEIRINGSTVNPMDYL